MEQSISRVNDWFQRLARDSVEVPRHEGITRETPTQHLVDEVNTVGIVPDNDLYTRMDGQITAARASRLYDAMHALIDNPAHGTPANLPQYNAGMPTANMNNDRNAYGANISLTGLIAPPNPYPYAVLGDPPEPQPIPGWYTRIPQNTFQAFSRMRAALPIRRSL